MAPVRDSAVSGLEMFKQHVSSDNFHIVMCRFEHAQDIVAPNVIVLTKPSINQNHSMVCLDKLAQYPGLPIG